MKNMKSRSLAQITIEEKRYSIRATIHALERMKERNVCEYAVTGSILALGQKRLLELQEALQEAQEDAMIIDEERDVAVVISFKGNRIQVVTVNKANVFVKKNKSVERI